MERLFPLGRRVNKVVAPVLSRVSSLPVAGDDVFGATRRFYDRLEGVREILTDTETTSVRLVVNPERMVIAEARRTYTYLSLFGYGVDAVIANRLLPDEIDDPWFATWKKLHAEHVVAIEEGFAPLPVLRAELAADELVGVDRLRDFGAALYEGLDPAARLHAGEPLRAERRGAKYALTLQLPFVDHDDVDLGRHGDELLVRVGPYRRSILLPDSLRRRKVAGAKLADGTLTVLFEGARNGSGPPSREGRGG
jgi:arsenite-transporting ATPase